MTTQAGTGAASGAAVGVGDGAGVDVAGGVGEAAERGDFPVQAATTAPATSISPEISARRLVTATRAIERRAPVKSLWL